MASSDSMRAIFAKPDSACADAGYGSELLIAVVRLLLVLLLLSVSITAYAAGPFDGRGQMLLGGAGLALLESLLVYSAARRHFGRSYIGFLSAMLDVALVSGGAMLATRLAPGSDVAALLFPAYFLAIGATSLRYDARICVAAGALACLLHGTLVAAGSGGVASWGQFAGQEVLLVAATALATAVVVRSRELRLLAIFDRLTGLANRGYFDERLRVEAASAARLERPLTVVMIDIDHFKAFNDTYGHRAGDEVLRALGGLLKGSFRATDLVARYGGEEIALVLPGMGPVDAMRRLESIRRAVERLPVSLLENASPLALTVSVGVATWPHDGRSGEDVLRSADERLYQAKRAGRNKVAGPLLSAEPARASLPAADA